MTTIVDFPDNVVAALASRLITITEADVVLKRPLRPTDPSGAVGVFALAWTPTEYEIGQYDPAVTRYSITIQTFVKHGDEQEGIVLHNRLAKRVRLMLYRDDQLRVLLGSLNVTDAGVTERLQRWGVEMQRYLSNELEGMFLYLAVTDLWVETEVV